MWMFVFCFFGKNNNMIDTKSKFILKILAQECRDGSYKVIEISDIIMSLPKRYRMDSESIKHILLHLERQDMISIKYDDEDVYCLAVLPFGYETIEAEGALPIRRERKKERSLSIMSIVLSFFSALVGTVIGILICHFLLKLF